MKEVNLRLVGRHIVNSQISVQLWWKIVSQFRNQTISQIGDQIREDLK